MKTYGVRHVAILLLVAVASLIVLHWVFDISLTAAIAAEAAMVALALVVMYLENKQGP